ncbi:unnamed protein product [Phaeothamnion confervicola]
MSESLPFLTKPKNLDGLVGNTGFDPAALAEVFPVEFLVEGELKNGELVFRLLDGREFLALKIWYGSKLCTALQFSLKILLLHPALTLYFFLTKNYPNSCRRTRGDVGGGGMDRVGDHPRAGRGLFGHEPACGLLPSGGVATAPNLRLLRTFGVDRA